MSVYDAQDKCLLLQGFFPWNPKTTQMRGQVSPALPTEPQQILQFKAVPQAHPGEASRRTLKESFGPRKENNSSQRLNHLTSEKAKQNLRSCPRPGPDAPGRLHLSGTYHPIQKPSTPYTCPEDLSPPTRLQMPSQLKNA